MSDIREPVMVAMTAREFEAYKLSREERSAERQAWAMAELEALALRARAVAASVDETSRIVNERCDEVDALWR